MKRFIAATIVLNSMLLAAVVGPAVADEPMRVGIIGLDTSHAPAFTRLLNQAQADSDLAGFRVVAANVKGSYDLEVSVVRQPGITEQMVKLGVPITESIRITKQAGLAGLRELP
jgi:hypothetical protein